jgi:hypothetical protein
LNYVRNVLAFSKSNWIFNTLIDNSEVLDITLYYLLISVVIKGYDSETGQYTAALTFDAIQVDDFGFYECLTEDQNKVIKSFQMYINSTKHLLLPIPQEVSPLIIVNAGKTAHVPCRLLNPTISGEIDLKLIRPVLLLGQLFL